MASSETSTEKKRGHPLVDVAIGLGAVALGFLFLEHVLHEGTFHLRHL